MLHQDEVAQVADLARIELKDSEIKEFQVDLSATLDFFKELAALDTETVEAIGHITGREGQARTDVVREASAATIALIKSNFPEEQDGYLKVRSVF